MPEEFCSVRVPASSANLGPGFDVLAVALAKYLTVSAYAHCGLRISAKGFGSSLPATEEHLAAKVAFSVLGDLDVHLEIESEIPLSRGLGSSAALCLGVAAALGASDPLKVAVNFEGHPENAAASFFGGAVAASSGGLKSQTSVIGLDEELVALLVIPEHEIPTKDARAVLPSQYSRDDVVFNLQRAVLLSHALSDLRLLSQYLFEDRVHQMQRGTLFPEAELIIEAMVRAGALGACWSGAGSTLIGFCEKSSSADVSAEVQRLLPELIRVKATVEVVDFDRSGLVYQ